ncbi:MAG TPA: ATP-binding protein [Candidatus Limnocylindrales bacterium]|nr:ATP-binding protein [Candidatus Limnocylindrales bacterium]
MEITQKENRAPKNETIACEIKLQTLFEGITDGLLMVGQDHTIEAVNQGFLSLMGKSANDFIHQDCHQPFQGAEPSQEPCPVCITFESGKPVHLERVGIAEKGRRIEMEISTFPLKNPDGKVVQAIVYVKDITEKRTLYRQVAEAERLTAVEQICATVAHELMNPLTSVLLNIELLEETLTAPEVQTQEARKSLEVIRSELERLASIVTEYHEFTRLPKTKLKRGNINTILMKLLEFLALELYEKRISVRKVFEADLPEVLIDVNQLRQVFLNLFRNAMEAMPQGGRLVVTTRTRDGKVEIEIVDTGVGIDKANLERIFEPFFTTKAKGSGLGLPLVRQILKEHRGEIECISEKGAGTTFIVWLPIAR